MKLRALTEAKGIRVHAFTFDVGPGVPRIHIFENEHDCLWLMIDYIKEWYENFYDEFAEELKQCRTVKELLAELSEHHTLHKFNYELVKIE